MCVLIVATGELAARAWGPREPGWDAWSRTFGAKLAELERRQRSGRAPEVLVVGDSTAAFNVMPAPITEHTGLSAYNLGTPGNFPRTFDVVIRRGVLAELRTWPKVLLVSFSSFSLDPDQLGQAPVILGSPLARRVEGSFVWADHLALVRLHERLRLLREPPPHRAVARMDGYEPYPDALLRRRRQPRLAQTLPPPPGWLTPAPPPVALEGDPLEPIRRLLDDARDHGTLVVLVSPPERDAHNVPAIAALAAERGVPHVDRSRARIPNQDGHMDHRGALVWSTALGRELKRILAKQRAPVLTPD